MKSIFTLLLLVAGLGVFAQTTTDFENFNIEIDSFNNGSDFSGGFTAETVFFPNTFTDFGTFTSWGGWSLSGITDNTTAGFSNQYSCISGSGYDNSIAYAVSFNQSHIELINTAAGKTADGFYINNSTYAYLSMLEGDSFAKKFGGESGDDPDYFLLTIKKYLDGQLSNDSLNFYLADFRFADNNEDFIVNDWTFVDLKPLGDVDSLSFSLTSTDVGAYGMNTPGYFCMDNFTTLDISTSNKEILEAPVVSAYPNPTIDQINIDLETATETSITIVNLTGQIVRNINTNSNKILIDVQDLNTGMYNVIINQNKKFYKSSFVKL